MNRKMTLVFVLMLALVAGITNNASAQTSYTLTTKVLDKYLGANGGVFYDAPVIQPDLFVAFRNGFYADLWMSRGEGAWWREFDSEVDATFGWANDHFDVGVAYFAIIDVVPGDVIQLYAKVTSSELRGSLRWYLWVEQYIPTAENNPRPGTMVRLGSNTFGSEVAGRLNSTEGSSLTPALSETPMGFSPNGRGGHFVTSVGFRSVRR